MIRLPAMDEGRKRVLLIAAAILAARNLARWDGRPSPAFEAAIANAISVAERILARIDARWPTKQKEAAPMIDTEVFSTVAKQLMSGDTVELEGQRLRVRRTSASRLRTVSFRVNDHRYTAIEQNPEKPSQWGQIARAGHQVVQFKDVATNRFVAVAVDGKVKVYGRKGESQ